MWVVIAGTPTSGFELFGPFERADDAVDWADRYMEDVEWWTMVVQAPDKLPDA
jgi:hypothetical protein